MLDQDITQRLKVAGLFLLQSYKVLTGTMLSIFIPQNCGDKICTLKENYSNTEVYHQVLFYWNTFSMFLFICSYLIELKREEWCVKYLDIDNNKSDNNLKQIIEKYPKLNNKIDNINKIYYYSFFFNCLVYSINLGITIKVLNDYYYNSATLSCFTSFVLLVLMKLYNSFGVAYQSIKNDKMTSAYVNEFISYNVMDADFLEQRRIEEQNIENNIVREEEIIPVIN